MSIMPFERYIVCLFFVCAVAVTEDNSAPDPPNFKVWGPGLRADFHMPVRYFYIQTVDKAGRNLTDQLPDIFVIHMRDNNGRQANVYATNSFLGDGLYVFRMRLRHSIEFHDLNLTIFYKSHLVTTVVLRKPLYGENCPCPNQNFTEWVNAMKCPKTYDQIEKDLDQFPSVNMKEVLDHFRKKIFHEGSVAACHYIINNNQIFRKCYGQHVGFHIFSDALLLSLTRKVVLPDMEFLWNLGDWPLATHPNYPLPIFSWCGSESSSDIVLPTYEITESITEMMGRQSIDLFSIMGRTTMPWNSKSDIAFFRGRDSSQERLDLVRLSLKHPELVDARLTNMFFFKNDSTLGQLQPHTVIFDFFKSKYQVNMDGTVSAYRTPYLLSGGSVMLKQESMYYEHFYSSLTENEHYVSLKQDISDLIEKIKWLRNHDMEAKRIAKAGRDYAFHHLSPTDIYCYYARVFERYSYRLSNRFEQESPGSEFVRVTKTDYVPIEKCRCNQKPGHHDEL